MLRLLSRLRPRRVYTVLILPHATPRLRKLHVSRSFLVAVLGIVVALGVAGLSAPHLLVRVQSEELRSEKLETENETLRRILSQALGDMNRRLEATEARAVHIARELDVPEASAPLAAGGPAEAAPRSQGEPLRGELDLLRERTETLELSMQEIGEAFGARLRKLAARPSLPPVRGWFSHVYGWRRDPFTGQREFHHGVDIVAPQGTEVRAPADGVVTRAASYAAYGKTVELRHEFGYETRFGHLSEILVRPDTRVRRGDVIGRVGSTGRSTGPHLHYEVFEGGRRVNPWRFLKPA